MKELSPQFLFGADAGTVYSFIMDLQEKRPDLFKNTSGEVNYTCWLVEGVRRDALYSIALEVSIWSTSVTVAQPGTRCFLRRKN
jgi:hypothetical protein